MDSIIANPKTKAESKAILDFLKSMNIDVEVYESEKHGVEVSSTLSKLETTVPIIQNVKFYFPIFLPLESIFPIGRHQ